MKFQFFAVFKYMLLTLIFVSACHVGERRDEDEKIARTYGEILFLTEKFKDDTLNLKMKIDSVLKANQISMRQIDSIAEEYNRDPKRWAEFFEKVKRYLENKKENAEAKKY